MKAVVVERPGGLEVLEVREVPRPVPAYGEVVVEVKKCGVCYRDIIDRKGGFPWIRFPVIPGHEIAGVVEEVGEGVEDLRKGDFVLSLHHAPCNSCPSCFSGNDHHCERSLSIFGLTQDGGYAEWVKGRSSAFLKVDPFLPEEEMAVLFCTFGTAWHALFGVGGVKGGETVLVTGATGGVGSAVIQLVSSFGGFPVAVTRKKEKVDFLKRLGAVEVILTSDGNYKFSSLADVVVENVGSFTFSSSLKALRPSGRMILIGNLHIQPVQVKLGAIIVRSLKVLGSDSCPRGEFLSLLNFLRKKTIRPTIGEVFPLSRVKDAQNLLEEGKVVGRVVLDPRR